MPEGISIGLMRVPPLIKKFLASTTSAEAQAALSPGAEAAYTPTFTGFGVVSAVNFTWVRAGNRLKVMGKFTVGTPTAVEARITLPGSLVSDASLITSIMVLPGIWENASAAYAGNIPVVFAESGVGYITFGFIGVGFAKQLGNVVSGVGQTFSLNWEVAISGWNA